MITLNWIFDNNHAWAKNFDSVDNAINYVEFCGMYSHYAIDRVWIDTNNEQIWLKEKSN
jgi:hypothetical protein